MADELSGKVAIVTGGAAGIGRAMVEKFHAEGALVVIADIDRRRGAALAADLGPDVAFTETDVAESDQVRDLVTTTVERFGGLHIMVNNAGVPTAMHARFLDDDLGDFQRVLEVDLLGVMLGTQHAARHMAGAGGGTIINISSIGGIRAGSGELSYRAAKAGVIHFSKCAAIDLARDGIRVNCIAPGAIRTEILSTATAHLPGSEEVARKRREVMKSIRPLAREGTAADIAEAAAYFAADRSGYVTGTVLPVDGGIVAGHATNALADILESGPAATS